MSLVQSTSSSHTHTHTLAFVVNVKKLTYQEVNFYQEP